MKQKTAIRQLIQFIDSEQGMIKDSFVLEIKKKAKALESVNEQQIKDARDKAILKFAKWLQDKGVCFHGNILQIQTPKEWVKQFNETFEKP